MAAGRVGADLDAFAARLQRVVVAAALAGVLAGFLASAAPHALARFGEGHGGPRPTAQTVFNAIHAKYEFPDQERHNFYFCVPKKYRETWKPDPSDTDYNYRPDECLDAVLTETLDVYEMVDDEKARALVSFNAPSPGQDEPSDRRWRQSGRFVLAWHSSTMPANPQQFEGMARVAEDVVSAE